METVVCPECESCFTVEMVIENCVCCPVCGKDLGKIIHPKGKEISNGFFQGQREVT